MFKKKISPYLYSMPSLLVIALVVAFPIIYTLYISFTNMNLYHWSNFKFIGFENFKKALFSIDSGFLAALLRTLLWTFLNIVIQLFLGFAYALLLNIDGLKCKGLYKTILMLPWAMPAYISILLWRMGIYNSEFGLLNQFMKKIGLSTVNWLDGDISAFICCLVLNLWIAMPFMILVIHGALQSIDKSYYESATIDGASNFVKITKITVPLVRNIIMPSVVLTTFVTFKQFDIVYLLTMQQGSKTGANINTVITYAYDNAFSTSNYGYSSAISVIIFVIIIGFTCILNRNLKEENS